LKIGPAIRAKFAPQGLQQGVVFGDFWPVIAEKAFIGEHGEERLGLATHKRLPSLAAAVIKAPTTIPRAAPIQIEMIATAGSSHQLLM
jgi:hypothetical protein